jgi:hypothetical protein
MNFELESLFFVAIICFAISFLSYLIEKFIIFFNYLKKVLPSFLLYLKKVKKKFSPFNYKYKVTPFEDNKFKIKVYLVFFLLSILCHFKKKKNK